MSASFTVSHPGRRGKRLVKAPPCRPEENNRQRKARGEVDALCGLLPAGPAMWSFELLRSPRFCVPPTDWGYFTRKFAVCHSPSPAALSVRKRKWYVVPAFRPETVV